MPRALYFRFSRGNLETHVLRTGCIQEVSTWRLEGFHLICEILLLSLLTHSIFRLNFKFQDTLECYSVSLVIDFRQQDSGQDLSNANNMS
jgi:hypothetical protein